MRPAKVTQVFPPSVATAADGNNGTLNVADWKDRLVHRPHGAWARPQSFRELSARIGHNGGTFFVPLGTDDLEVAARRAQELDVKARADGWPAVLERQE